MANYDPEYMNEPMHERLHRHGQHRYCQSGTPGIEFHEGLEPLPGETVVVKHRFDAFFDTDLHVTLQARGIRTVILAGIAVQGCVDSTTRHAYFLGYSTRRPTRSSLRGSSGLLRGNAAASSPDSGQPTGSHHARLVERLGHA